MPQQPKITGDVEVDSWALQVTQELNNTTQTGGGGGGGGVVTAVTTMDSPLDLTDGTLSFNDGEITVDGQALVSSGAGMLTVGGMDIGGGGDVTHTIGTAIPAAGTEGHLFSLTEDNGGYGAGLYIFLDGEWRPVDPESVQAPPTDPLEVTPRAGLAVLTYVLGFTAGSQNTTRGRVNGYSSGATIGFDFGVFGNTTFTAGTPSITSNNRYHGSATNSVADPAATDFNNLQMNLPTPAQWNAFQASPANGLTGSGSDWAFWSGSGGAGRGTQMGFIIPHPARINFDLTVDGWPRSFPFVPWVAVAGRITLTVTRVSTGDIVFNTGYSPNSANSYLIYDRGNFSGLVWSRNGQQIVPGSTFTGGITTPTARSNFEGYVDGEEYIVRLTVNGTFDVTSS